jgi:hypothetical protein
MPEEVGLFVTDARTFIAQEEVKVISSYCSLKRPLHKYGEMSASAGVDSTRLPDYSHVSFYETLEQFRQFILHFISCVYSVICLRTTECCFLSIDCTYFT